MERGVRNIHGGGVAAFIRSGILSRRRKDIECNELENITYEVILNKSKSCFLCVYRPPHVSNEFFGSDLSKTLDKCITHYDHYSVIGDLNYDLISEMKGKPLTDLTELFSLTNLIKEPTCFKTNCTSSLLDVFLTNSKPLSIRTLNFSSGVSVYHNLISTVINNTVPKASKPQL